MAQFDLPLAQLREYRPPMDEPAGFDDFWTRTLDEAAQVPLDARVEPVDALLPGLDVHDVTYAGAGGDPVRAWLVLPRWRGLDTGAGLPCVVTYLGYGNGRGLAHDWTTWPSAGFAQLVMDTRGQGSDGAPGDTADPVAGGPAAPGFLTRGIDDPATHYYRRVFVDAVRAVELARTHAGLDPDRVLVGGHSQGGGIGLAVAGLVPGLLGVMADEPFLCSFERAIEVTDAAPYAEITTYLSTHRGAEERVFETLAHVDGRSFARRATAPALFSVALMDDICPPSTVFAAYAEYGGDKQIEVYPYNGHEGGQAFHVRRQLGWARDLVTS